MRSPHNHTCSIRSPHNHTCSISSPHNRTCSFVPRHKTLGLSVNGDVYGPQAAQTLEVQIKGCRRPRLHWHAQCHSLSFRILRSPHDHTCSIRSPHNRTCSFVPRHKTCGLSVNGTFTAPKLRRSWELQIKGCRSRGADQGVQTSPSALARQCHSLRFRIHA
jgi:hypothetical protein